MGPSITSAVLSFLNSGHLLKQINYTHIALIPKIPSPVTPVDFRPISLCNVQYKIISKTLSNRLKVILPSYISQSQNAFVPSRLISDRSLLPCEFSNLIAHSKSGNNFKATLKLDMSKSFDRVNWDFLALTLTNMGFSEKWVNLLCQCFSTISYSLHINGAPTERFNPQRGLRQGDPLSPYLFIIYLETLLCVLNHLDASDKCKGLKLSRTGISLSHLFFADDCLIFFKPNLESCGHLKRALVKILVASKELTILVASLVKILIVKSLISHSTQILPQLSVEDLRIFSMFRIVQSQSHI